jgi:tRNA/tmRNA/rRNA uracil-C5-methylase (TrmA/RlmC/RlmD family)
MSEKEAYIRKWIQEVSKNRLELGGFAVCPYASTSKTLIVETTIDDIVPEPGYDVIIFIIEEFWRPNQIQKWVSHYNEKFQYYKFFKDLSSKDIPINGIQTNNQKYNLILCQSKKKLSKIRKKLMETENYTYWSEEYLKEILGDDIELLEKLTED